MVDAELNERKLSSNQLAPRDLTVKCEVGERMADTVDKDCIETRAA